MKYNLKSITIGEIITKIKKKELYLKPNINENDYDSEEVDLNNESDVDLVQRNYIWKNSQKQNLIRTIFTDFLISTIIVYKKEESENYQYFLIDGKERINIIWMYHEDKFKYISNDGVIRKNRKFSELTENEKNRFEKFKIPIIVLKNLDIEELSEILENLKVNSRKLKLQEIYATYNNILPRENIQKRDKIIVKFNEKNDKWEAKKEGDKKNSFEGSYIDTKVKAKAYALEHKILFVIYNKNSDIFQEIDFEQIAKELEAKKIQNKDEEENHSKEDKKNFRNIKQNQ